MAKVIVYSKPYCPYCDNAKQLLQSKNISFEEIRVDLSDEKREEMMRLSGQRTVPQIFINGQSIGGFTDLAALDESGKLDELLKN